MAVQLQLRSGTTTQHSTFIGAVGEVTVDTTKDVLVVHDGITAGGFPVAARANADGTVSLIKKDGTSVGEVNSSGLFNNTLTSTNTNQALTALQGKILNDQAFGIGQTWQDMTSSRVSGTTYTNTTGRPIQLHIMTGTESSTFNIGASTLTAHGNSMIQSTVPDSTTYSFGGVVVSWWELR